MSEYPCFSFDDFSDLGCDNLQLFEGVIDIEVPKQTPDIQTGDAINWRTEEETYDFIYEVRSNRNMGLEEEMDDNSPSVENWTSKNIIKWICEQYSKNNKKYELLPLAKFRTITINEFKNMQVNDFLNKIHNSEDAEFLYNCKERLFESGQMKRVEDWSNKDLLEWICKMYNQDNRRYESIQLRHFKNVTIKQFEKMGVEDLHILLDTWDDATFLYKCKNDLFGCSSYSNQAVYDVFNRDVNSSSEVNSTGVYDFYNKSAPVCNTQVRDNNYSVSGSNTEPTRIRKRGRPRTKELQPVKNERRTGKLWEFLRNLLMNKETCPSLIKWENYDEGMFKFVQNEKVAKLWGERKKNGKMNYEKFSRAMRYYYRNNILQPVSGKRLVYKFGPNATGWRDRKPIL